MWSQEYWVRTSTLVLVVNSNTWDEAYFCLFCSLDNTHVSWDSGTLTEVQERFTKSWGDTSLKHMFSLMKYKCAYKNYFLSWESEYSLIYQLPVQTLQHLYQTTFGCYNSLEHCFQMMSWMLEANVFIEHRAWIHKGSNAPAEHDKN